MTYQQTIDYLYDTLPMFTRIGSAAFKKDLTNTVLLCERLGNPQRSFKSIHVGGTNGKGSVSHLLAATLQTAGYKTGLYTSPHLYDFRERIKINGSMAAEEFVIRFVEKMAPAIAEIQPSFFEITVAMAFACFAEQHVDIAVIEVGLGGRLDSTNIITPVLSVITNIGFDHVNLLGNTLEAIAFEKAGIIKEGVPVVIGEKHKETSAVFEQQARRKNAPLLYAQDIFTCARFRFGNPLLEVTVNMLPDGPETTYQLDLPGIYQTKNILTFLTAIRLLKAWNISEAHIKKALLNVKSLTGLQGRWEMIRTNPPLVLEAAHNEDGIRQMLLHLQSVSCHRLHLIIGMVKDKDADSVLRLLPTGALYYFTNAHIPRALAAQELAEQATANGLSGNCYNDVNEAIESALSLAAADDLILVCGSIFLVAEADRERWSA